MPEYVMAYSGVPLAVRVVTFASRQHGILDSRELARARVARSTVARWVASGRLFRVHHGVYSVVHPSMLTVEARWLAAVKACGPDVVLSHGPAGQLGGILPRRERLGLHVSLAARTPRKPSGIIVHRPRHLEPRDTTVRLWIPTTSVTRTVWDLASTLPSQQVRRAFEQAGKFDRLDRHRLADLSSASPSRKGAATIRQLLAERPLPLAEVRSWLEELLLEICVENGLPLPAVNVPLLGYEVDFLWEPERFVIEADGRDHEIRDSAMRTTSATSCSVVRATSSGATRTGR